AQAEATSEPVYRPIAMPKIKAIFEAISGLWTSDRRKSDKNPLLAIQPAHAVWLSSSIMDRGQVTSKRKVNPNVRLADNPPGMRRGMASSPVQGRIHGRLQDPC